MERYLLAALIIAVLFLMLLMEQVLPQVSAVVLIFIFMFAYAWLLTAAMVHQKRKERKSPRVPDLTYLPKVSILVPAHNEERVIAKTVEMLMALNYPDFEVLVIDDRSTDGTADVLQELQRQYPTGFRYHLRLPGQTPGKSAVLNEALTLTDGDVLCVFDADAQVNADFLKNIMPFLADETIGGVQARKVIANAPYNWITRCQDYEYSLDAHFQYGRDTIKGAVELRGNGQLVKREALASVDGWNTWTVTDDLDLSTKLHLAGWDIRFAHKVLVLEEGITGFMPLLRQRRRWAEGSLLRYLEYAGKLLTSNRVSLRTTADMIAYFVEFLFPLWLFADHTVLALKILSGDPSSTHLISSLLLVPLLTIFFSSAIVVAIVRFNKLNPFHAFPWALLTGLYMTLIWVPVVFWVMVKVLFQKERSLNWGKTEHFGVPDLAYLPVGGESAAPSSQMSS